MKKDKENKKNKKDENQKKRRFRWWVIPVVILLVPIIAVGGLFGYLSLLLPENNLLAATSNLQMELSPEQWEQITNAPRDYSTLPDVLRNADGTKVETAADYELRREEILQLFKDNVYGALPEEGFYTNFEVIEMGYAFDQTAVRKQIKITVYTEKGMSEALMLLYLPVSYTKVPVIFGLNFNGNHTVVYDEKIMPSYAFDTAENEDWEENRGKNAARWNIEENIRHGYAVATVYCNDFAPDNAKTYSSRVVSLFDEPEFKAIGAWAFGLMRCVDYLVKDAALDTSRIAVIGHSRLGKAAVWAGANDERIGLVISNDSGNSGASLSRSNQGETVASINAVFPHWFCSEYAKYGKNENALPVDQHLLLAAIAPRKVYVASAESDLWADPQGAWNSLMFARDAFSLYGLEVLPYSEAQPEADTPAWCSSMGYHVRTGWHDVQYEDWVFYLEYMETYF